MKKFLTLLTVILSFQVTGQTFRLTDDSRQNFSVCQHNHNIILDKYIYQMNSQGGRLIRGISIEHRAGTSDYKLKLFRSALTDVVLRRIIYSEIKKQLNRQTLESFYSVKANYHKDYLNVDTIQVDLNAELSTHTEEIKNISKINVAKDLMKSQYDAMLSEALTRISSKRYQKIGVGIYSRIAGKSVGKIATGQVLKRATLSFGSKLFISASKGVVIDLLTMPLKGSRLPPESLWTDLLEEYPELIIVPEWMKRGGIGDHAWGAHCNAIQRRTDHMKDILAKNLKLEESNFIKRVTLIKNLDEEISAYKDDENKYGYRPVAIDNTYVHRPVMSGVAKTPSWARTLSIQK